MTAYVSGFAVKTQYEDIPNDVMRFGKKSKLEALGVGLLGSVSSPGRIMSEQVRRRHFDEWILEHAAREIPVGRYGGFEVRACLATLLASPIVIYITGTVAPVGGGLYPYAF